MSRTVTRLEIILQKIPANYIPQTLLFLQLCQDGIFEQEVELTDTSKHVTFHGLVFLCVSDHIYLSDWSTPLTDSLHSTYSVHEHIQS